MKWSKAKGDWFAEVHLDGSTVHFDDGPANPTARGHEGMGGSQSLKEFMTNPAPWIFSYPGFYEEIMEDLKKLPHRAGDL